MPFADLSNVTRTLRTLLEENIQRIAEVNVEVSARAPEDVTADTTSRLSLFLYHVAEDGYYKNAPGQGADLPDVAHAPMALDLYYILTAHLRSADEEEDAFGRQDLMGYALKTFHDFPIVTDDTEIGGTAILAENLRGRGNTLQIVLRPVPPEDALAFWSSEDAHTARLSAYYEVRVVMLEPEEPTSMPGVVLEVGNYLFQLGAPHLECSRSTVRFDLPPAAGGGEQTIDASPARVSPVAPHGRLVLEGVHLASGAPALILKNARWTAQDPPVEEADAGAWNPEFSAGRVEVDVQGSLVHDGGSLDVLPGIYTALVRVVLDQRIVMGELEEIAASSNEVPLVVAPRLSGPPVVAANQITVNVAPDLSVPELADAVQLIFAGAVYQRADALADGRFTVGAATLTLQRFPGLAPGTYPLRVVVDGADSQPFWVELP